MDRSWIKLKDKFSNAYIQGVHSFLEFAYRNQELSEKVHCPCRKCANVYCQIAENVRKHLLEHGMIFSYTKWYLHGETDDMSNINTSYQYDNFNDHDDMFEMLQAIQDEHMAGVGFDLEFGNSETNSNQNEESYTVMDKLLENALRPLFPEWPHSSLLSFIIRMLKVKVECRMSDKAFDLILAILNDIAPYDNSIPKNYYETKKLLRDLGLGWDPIHACTNDCVLFWKDLEDMDECPECHESRWRVLDSGERNNKIPQKVMRFFPSKPRLKRLFMSKEIAYNMRWHKEKRVQDDVMRHPADGEAWRHLDEKFPEFAHDPRNVRLGLATDGFNPFGNMSNSYSMWPVMLMPYNLPPWRCMKDDYTILSTLIPGPKAPGKDIDVYLQPLIEELKDLWENGVRTYDADTKTTFSLHAVVIWTINDFPAYGDLSGWSTKGKLACPICNENTSSNSILDKICFMGHRRYLPKDHYWRRSKKFNGKVEYGKPPNELTGNDILAQLERLPEMKLGKSLAKKKRKRSNEELNWTKKSIFFELPYWKELKIRHFLDVMHIEKNIFDNILGTLLSIEGKNKDTEKARKDLEAMNIRKELHLKSKNGRTYKPPACYTLSRHERYGFCQFLKSVKFPDGYAAKISTCVRDTKIFGLKSHDCHVILQRLLPIGMRGHLDKNVLNVITELSSFFRELCSKILHRDALEKLQKKIITILCTLEMIFPPAFFDVMVHLTIHLLHEAMLGGPVHYRWMYPVERTLGTYKRSVRNKARPEGSIAEAYTLKECVIFCKKYVGGIETQIFHKERYKDKEQLQGATLSIFSHSIRAIGAASYVNLSFEDHEMATWYILNNCEEIRQYIDKHEKVLIEESHNAIEERKRKQFPSWFKNRIMQMQAENPSSVSEDIYSLAVGGDLRVCIYQGCIVNGVKFLTKMKDSHLSTQNSGVSVQGEHKNKYITFYGILNDIIQFKFPRHKVYLFRCEWFDLEHKKPIQINEYFTSINVTKTWYQSDPFILATQATQVFYIPDPEKGLSHQVVQRSMHRHLFDPLLFEDELSQVNEEACQEAECLDVRIPILSQEIGKLVRDDVVGEFVGPQSNIVETQAVCIEDDFDDTLEEYCSDDENIMNNNGDDQYD